MKIILASNNAHKVSEISALLNPLGFEVISQADAGINIDTEETGATFEENAALKARAVYELCKTPTAADDSGLMVDFLNGAPGVYSHRYAGENATDKDRYTKLLEELKDVPFEKRTAHFVCAICYIDENGKEKHFRGECKGKIGFEPKGENGFGYDPVFVLENGNTFAELTPQEKNAVSHRSRALSGFADYLEGIR